MVSAEDRRAKARARWNAWYAKTKETRRKYRASQAEKFNAWRREQRATNPEYREKDNARSSKYHKDHRDEQNAKVRAYQQANAEKIREARKEYFAKYREANREACRARCRPHYRKNKAKRRAATLQRTPAWADMDAIAFFYDCAPAGHHVDHIIPLRGKYVSGLHVASNLQWLPDVENLRKGNRFDFPIPASAGPARPFPELASGRSLPRTSAPGSDLGVYA